MRWKSRVGWASLPLAVVLVGCSVWLAVTWIRIGSNPPDFNPHNDLHRLVDVQGSRDDALRTAGRFLKTYGIPAACLGIGWSLLLLVADFARARWRELIDALHQRPQ